MNDPVQQTEEFVTHTAGGVVLNEQKNVLVVNQKGSSWSLPKGHVEAGEDLLTAAKREIYEEAGVTNLHLVKELPVYERYKIGEGGIGEDKSEKKVIHFFLFTTTEMLLRPVDPENPEARWVPQHEVSQLLTHAKDKEFFESILSQLSNS
jgi:ADP-ribose pyrophosphatase YjhB (NUDIX family)